MPGGGGPTGHPATGPHPALDPRPTPQPIGAPLQRIRPSGAGDAVTPRTYVHAAGCVGSPCLAAVPADVRRA